MSDSKVLNFLNISDKYERQARFIPAMLTVAVFAPAAFVLSIPIMGWIVSLIAGVGIGAVFAVGFSQLASAVGNKYQRSLFPNWPHDSPTNQRLSPLHNSCSKQQRQIWYDEIRQLTNLDIASIDVSERHEVEQIVNDSIAEIRTQLWKHPNAERLHLQNTDYGFARNFSGFWPFWLPMSIVSFGTCWLTFFITGQGLSWAVIATLVMCGLALFHFVFAEQFVRAKSEHYADSFFNSIKLLLPAGESSSPESQSSSPAQKSTTSKETPDATKHISFSQRQRR